MELKIKLSDWLVAYLKKIAVSHLFGSPGDLVIKLFSGSIGRGRSMSSRFRTNQAWALPPMVTRGRPAGIGAICVTYGAGGDNMVKPVARHFASACRYSSSAAARERKNPTLAC